jgi:hypothetical protein
MGQETDGFEGELAILINYFCRVRQLTVSDTEGFMNANHSLLDVHHAVMHIDVSP